MSTGPFSGTRGQALSAISLFLPASGWVDKLKHNIPQLDVFYLHQAKVCLASERYGLIP
jgi:hypothetical protein